MYMQARCADGRQRLTWFGRNIILVQLFWKKKINFFPPLLLTAVAVHC